MQSGREQGAPWWPQYLPSPRTVRAPLFQEDTALGEARGWQSRPTSLPTCTRTSFFMGVLEKSGAEAGEREGQER